MANLGPDGQIASEDELKQLMMGLLDHPQPLPRALWRQPAGAVLREHERLALGGDDDAGEWELRQAQAQSSPAMLKAQRHAIAAAFQSPSSGPREGERTRGWDALERTLGSLCSATASPQKPHSTSDADHVVADPETAGLSSQQDCASTTRGSGSRHGPPSSASHDFSTSSAAHSLRETLPSEEERYGVGAGSEGSGAQTQGVQQQGISHIESPTPRLHFSAFGKDVCLSLVSTPVPSTTSSPLKQPSLSVGASPMASKGCRAGQAHACSGSEGGGIPATAKTKTNTRSRAEGVGEEGGGGLHGALGGATLAWAEEARVGGARGERDSWGSAGAGRWTGKAEAGEGGESVLGVKHRGGAASGVTPHGLAALGADHHGEAASGVALGLLQQFDRVFGFSPASPSYHTQGHHRYCQEHHRYSQDHHRYSPSSQSSPAHSLLRAGRASGGLHAGFPQKIRDGRHPPEIEAHMSVLTVRVYHLVTEVSHLA